MNHYNHVMGGYVVYDDTNENETMILRRMGNKAKLAKELQRYFPQHMIYMEPFFGAGGMFFNKPLAKYNYLNDIDNDVFNLFYQVQFNYESLKELCENFPYHKAGWNWLKTLQPENDLMKAFRFVILSNYGYLGKPETLRIGNDNHKSQLLKNLDKTFDFLCKNSGSILFNNVDFRKFFAEFSTGLLKDLNDAFVYCDPPYLECTHHYSDGFTKQDFIKLIDTLKSTGFKFAVSEFDNPFIIETAKANDLNVIPIVERRSLKSRSTEILITNYNHSNLFT